MYRGTLEGARLATLLYELQADLNNYTNADVLSGDPGTFLAVCTSGPIADNGELSDEVHETFSAANTVIRDFNECQLPPAYALTNYVLRAAGEPNTPVCIDYNDDQLCFEAELRTVRTLRLNEQAKPLPRGHAPAAVAFDTLGVPFGYLKSSGRHVGLAWRTATVDTAAGEQRVPAGSFFSLVYGDGDESVQDRYRGDGRSPGLISLADAPRPDDIRLQRFSALLVTRELARAAYLFAVGPNEDYPSSSLRQYIPEVLDTSLSSIGYRVHALLKSDMALRAA